jgi:hypothetical protein
MNSGTLIPLNKYKVHKDIFKKKKKTERFGDIKKKVVVNTQR